MKVAVSGHFNPIHKGHLAYLKAAAELGDELIVIVNNDGQVKLKGSKPFMDENERLEIVKAIRYVNQAYLSIDHDKTVRRSLKKLRPDIFAKGGDSNPDNIPELDLCRKLGISVVIGVGGGKVQSSSWLKKQ